MIREAINTLSDGNNLTYEEASEVMREIMTGGSPAQTAAFLTALHIKGETVDEITATVQSAWIMIRKLWR